MITVAKVLPRGGLSCRLRAKLAWPAELCLRPRGCWMSNLFDFLLCFVLALLFFPFFFFQQIA